MGRPLALPAPITAVVSLERLLSAHAARIGSDFAGYRNHCYRVLNFCIALSNNEPATVEKVAVAAAFHDIGIWTEGTFDYLEPSVQAAAAYLQGIGRDEWIAEISRMIREHHKVTPVREVGSALAEAFRRADWIDVSMGLRRFGLPRAAVREAFSIWPSAGFHRRLIQLSWQRLKSHPGSPLPMVKF